MPLECLQQWYLENVQKKQTNELEPGLNLLEKAD